MCTSVSKHRSHVVLHSAAESVEELTELVLDGADDDGHLGEAAPREQAARLGGQRRAVDDRAELGVDWVKQRELQTEASVNTSFTPEAS